MLRFIYYVFIYLYIIVTYSFTLQTYKPLNVGASSLNINIFSYYEVTSAGPDFGFLTHKN